MNDQDPPELIRAPAEVAKRSLALFSVVGLALGADRSDILEWLEAEGLIDALSPVEARFLQSEEPSDREVMNMSWRSEALLVLLWALSLIEALPPLSEQCDTSEFQDILPPFAETSVAEIIDLAKLRPDSELEAFAQATLDAHWKARQAFRTGVVSEDETNLDIVQERHHAINWILGYGNDPWDDVTADT